jgi:hypothetical protein
MRVIDYLLYTKLIFKNKNIYLEDEHYREIISYLLPENNFNKIIYYLSLCKKYNNSMNVEQFISNYNLKEVYFRKYNKLMVSITYKLVYFDIFNILIIYVNFYTSKYLIPIYYDTFKYEIPLNLSKYVCVENFKDFEKMVEDIWEKTNTLCMHDIVFSYGFKKIVYYQIYKKCFKKIMQKLTM